MSASGTTGSPGQADSSISDRVREALRLVIDPEIGINIVDLGLVYRIEVADGDARIDVTMTTPACPLSEYVSTSAEASVRREVPELYGVSINLVWDPPWRPDMMSDDARRLLGGR